jgi:hypothetical protein
MATKVLDTINLIGKDTRKVVKLSGTFFYKEGTKMITDFPLGYHRYNYNGVVFTVPVDNDFHADLKSGKVHEVVINQVEDEDDKELTRYQFTLTSTSKLTLRMQCLMLSLMLLPQVVALLLFFLPKRLRTWRSKKGEKSPFLYIYRVGERSTTSYVGGIYTPNIQTDVILTLPIRDI